MKKLIFFTALFSFITCLSFAQLRAKAVCPEFYVDILNGKVNNVKPDFSAGEIKKVLPCFTAEDSPTAKCGTGLIYKDRDLVFHIQSAYVEIGEKFKGKLSIPLLGSSRNSLFKWLGNPKIKDDTWDAFEMAYGTLVLHYSAAGKVNLVQMSTKGTEELTLCQ
jgi:hypothetical protein